jgi:uncharacterized protein (TIGR02145 family)
MKLRLFPTAFIAAVLLGCVKDQVPQEVVDNDPDVIDYVDEYGVNHGPGIKIGIHVWAPVNCGYHATDYKYGKMYQWGRKYGQGYDESDASVPEIVEGPVSLEIGQSKENANKFYYNSHSPYDWSKVQNDDLWNTGTESAPVKTKYDLCPNGWRVPTFAELDELCKNRLAWATDENGQSGYWFSGENPYAETGPRVFFPAAGFRHYIYGNADGRGYGYYWSSRPDSSKASSLFLDVGLAEMNFYSYRAYGYSVRCVQVTD